MLQKPWQSLSAPKITLHNLNTFVSLHLKFLSEKAIPQQSFGLKCTEIPWIPLCTLLLQMPSYSARTSGSSIKPWDVQKKYCCASQDYSHWAGRWCNCTRTRRLKQRWAKMEASARQVGQLFFFLMPNNMPAPGASGYLGKTVVSLPIEEVYIILPSVSRGCYYVPGRTRSQ